MGREWHWSRSVAATRAEGKAALGCMSGMRHLLDFHQLLFTTSTKAAANSSPPHHHCSPPELLKGVEAPRNSLELDERTSSTTSTMRDEYYDIPVGVQLSMPSAIVAKKKALSPSELEEERRSTDQVGTPRTPNLVARLMGLDVLPDQPSPPTIHCRRSRSYSAPTTPPLLEIHDQKKKKTKKKCKLYVEESRRESPPPPPRRPLQNKNGNFPPPPQAKFDVGSRSLPDTPRASWDVDPRLSLQSNKENAPWPAREPRYSVDEVLHAEQRTKKDSLKPREENKSPKTNSHATEIVKQVKESLSNRKGEQYWIKSKRTRPAGMIATTDGEPCSQKPPPVCSPRTIQLLEPPRLPKPSRPKPTPSPPPPSSRQVEANARVSKCKKPGYERFNERIRQQPQPPPARLAEVSARQSQLPQRQTLSCFVTIKRRESTAPPCPTEEKPGNAQEHQIKDEEQEAEFQYVRSILVHAGFIGTRVFSYRTSSPSHLVDPIIFHKLELEEEDKSLRRLGPLRHRWNRKLLFHLVQEILLEIPDRPRGVDGESLLLRLWAGIRSFPEADCRVAGDIDSLVELDLPENKVRQLLRHPAVAEEAERVASEIEADILDSILGETAASLSLFSEEWFVT